MAYDNLKDNKNAEKWTLEEATKFMNKAVELSNTNKFDFIGEVAKKMGSYIDVFDYITEKFTQLEHLKTRVKRNCEVNCFSNGKNGDIIPSLAIMNLKSNHGWTDRIDTTTKDKPITDKIDYSQLSTDTLKEIANATSKD